MNNKNEIIKQITRYLKENNYEDVALSLQKESGVYLYNDHYNYIYNFLTQNQTEINNIELYNDCLNYIRNTLSKNNSLSNEISLFYLSIYNSIFYQKIYFNFDTYGNKSVLIENIQSHLSIIKQYTLLYPQYEQLFQSQIQNIQNSITAIFTVDKNIYLKFFPEIASKQTLISFIDKIYYNINLKHKKTLDEITAEIYKYSIIKCKYHNINSESKLTLSQPSQSVLSLLDKHKCTKTDLIPSTTLISIDTKHEVTNLVFSNTGKYFLAVLSNYNLITYSIIFNNQNTEINQIKSFSSQHTALITSATWNSKDSLILTSSKDKTIKLIDPFKGVLKRNFTHVHDDMVSYAVFTHNDTKIASCAMDYRINLTNIASEKKEISKHVPGITISEVQYSQFYNILIVVSATNNTVVYYDLQLQNEKHKHEMNDVVVSCSISKKDKGKFLLINTSKANPVIEMVDLRTFEIVAKYFGHRQERFTIKCNFGGFNENFIVCGSENANVYVWSRTSSIPISVSKVHVASVNEVVWPYINGNNVIISCSDDHTIAVMVNKNIKKVYFNQGQQLENKTVEIGMEENTNRQRQEISTSRETNVINESESMLSRLGNILRNIRYFHDEDEF
jgi:WD40 repeat protein